MGSSGDSKRFPEHIRSEHFRDVDASGLARDAIANMDEIRGDPFIIDLKQRSYVLMDARAGAAVLDVGCGSGDDVLALARLVDRAGRGAGIDLSKAMIAEARGRAEAAGLGVDLLIAAGDALPFADATFDAVRSERVLQHVADPLAVLREMVRVTKPGGRVLAVDPDRGVFGSDFAGWDLDVEFRLGRWAAADGRVRNALFGRQVRRHLVEMGLRDVVAHALVNTSTAELERRPHIIDDYLERAVAAGVVTADEAAARGRAMRSALAAGTLHTTTLFWMTVGTKRD